jgi:hypothetical protein
MDSSKMQDIILQKTGCEVIIITVDEQIDWLKNGYGTIKELIDINLNVPDWQASC